MFYNDGVVEVVGTVSGAYYSMVDESFGTQGQLQFLAFLHCEGLIGEVGPGFLCIGLDHSAWHSPDITESLYWLSGGDAEWIGGGRYTMQWSDACPLYYGFYSSLFSARLDSCETLGDVSSFYADSLSLGTLYSFALTTGIAFI